MQGQLASVALVLQWFCDWDTWSRG